MPAFKFECPDHGEYKKIFKERPKTYPCPTCGVYYNVQLSSSLSTIVYDMKDRYHGKSVRKDVEKMLKRRSRDHHDQYELAEKIDKFGLDDAKKFGWTKKMKKV